MSVFGDGVVTRCLNSEAAAAGLGLQPCGFPPEKVQIDSSACREACHGELVGDDEAAVVVVGRRRRRTQSRSGPTKWLAGPTDMGRMGPSYCLLLRARPKLAVPYGPELPSDLYIVRRRSKGVNCKNTHGLALRFDGSFSAGEVDDSWIQICFIEPPEAMHNPAWRWSLSVGVLPRNRTESNILIALCFSPWTFGKFEAEYSVLSFWKIKENPHSSGTCSV